MYRDYQFGRGKGGMSTEKEGDDENGFNSFFEPFSEHSKGRASAVEDVYKAAGLSSSCSSTISSSSPSAYPCLVAFPTTSPCAACKLLRRRCTKQCVFAPYFPSEDPHRFASVHRIFGASNVSKMLQEIPMEMRRDAVSSLVYEANARMQDPIYGCTRVISNLNSCCINLHKELTILKAKLFQINMQMKLRSTSPEKQNFYPDLASSTSPNPSRRPSASAVPCSTTLSTLTQETSKSPLSPEMENPSLLQIFSANQDTTDNGWNSTYQR